MQIKDLKISEGVISFQYDNGLQARLYFVKENILRFQIDPSGEFSNLPTVMENVEVPDEGDATVGTGGSGQKLNTPILLPGIAEQVYAAENLENGLKARNFKVLLDEALTRVEIFNQEGKEVLLQEGQPIENKENHHLALRFVSSPAEYFFGGGTQNGFVNLKGKKIQIENQNMWTDGGVASPAPFFFSTNGYGVLVNTFTKGSYSFHTPRSTVISHEDTKLDLFIILGDTPASLIHGYHTLTGTPHLSPLYTYYPAHLNAYNRDYWVEVTEDSDGAIAFPDGKFYKEYQPIKEKTFNTGYRVGTIEIDGQKLVPNVSITKKVTFIDPDEKGNPKTAIHESLNGEKENYPFSARAIIDRYKKYDLPLGWFLPNDGYGAGYGQTDSLAGDIENLKEFGNYARENGVELGLWTQENLAPKNPKAPEKEERDLEKEVQVAGVTALKTDVAWVGEGYTFGLNGVSDAYEKMHKLSEKRPFIVSLDGWAGTQRYASIWSGDQEGSDWQNVKFHIPTYLSTGVSGNPNVGGDIDGIFGGNDPIIQTRDLQWKSFTPLQLSMDGWGSKPKDLGIQFGPEFLDINRFYLKLKTTLLPYFYSLAHEANETGAPILRPTFFNEGNEFTYGSSLEKQFLVGANLLVAPIFEPYQMTETGDAKRASLYLPDEKTTWYDFFTGDAYKGGQSLADFDAPLWKLPLFVKAGSILPFFNPTNQVQDIDRSKRHYVVYPSQELTTFTEYEDDGISNGFENEEILLTNVAQRETADKVVVTIGKAQGEGYQNFVENRETTVEIFLPTAPKKVLVAGKEISDWSYEDKVLPTFAPKDSPSHFAQQTLSCGKFVKVTLPSASIFTPLTVEILK